MQTPKLNEVKQQAGFSLEDINIEGFAPMPSPAEIKKMAPLTEAAAENVNKSRNQIKQILTGEDNRLMVITGPCSIHDPKAALDYAQRLAELGYVTITADAAYQGASGGTPRNTDKPYFRTEDIHGMADFISAYAGVDKDRLGVLGICGGGGYTLNAAKSDKRFKAVATLSMFNSGQVRRNGYMNSQLDTVQERLQLASDARAEEIATGKIAYSGTVDFDALTEESINKITNDLYREGMMYYGKTHRHPNSTFAYTTSSLMELMSWDAADNIELIDQPLLMMAGSKADSLYMSQEAFQKATGTQEKELFLVDGATHIQTYYQPQYVNQFVAKLQDFYGAHL